jgi:hypothetical protein
MKVKGPISAWMSGVCMRVMRVSNVWQVCGMCLARVSQVCQGQREQLLSNNFVSQVCQGQRVCLECLGFRVCLKCVKVKENNFSRTTSCLKCVKVNETQCKSTRELYTSTQKKKRLFFFACMRWANVSEETQPL